MNCLKRIKSAWNLDNTSTILHSRLFISFFVTYLFAFIAHGYGFLHNSVGHDSITHFYSGGFFEGINLWKVQLGRWFVPIYRGLVSGYLNMPWLISLIAFFWIALSVYLCVKMFKIQNRVMIVLTAALMVVNITISTQIATYIHEFDVDVFALFLSTASAYILVTSKKKYRFAICGFCLLLVLGIYQSYIAVFLVIVLLYYNLVLLRGERFRSFLLDGLKAIAVTASSGIVYVIMCKVFCLIYNTELETTSGNSLAKSADILQNGLLGVIKRVVGTYQDYFRVVLRPVSVTQLHIIEILGIVILLIGVGSFVLLLIKRRVPIINKIFAAVIMAMIPFAMNFACFFSGWTHTLTHYAFSLTYFVAMLLVREACADYESNINRKKLITLVKCVMVTCIAITVFNGVKISNMIYTQRELNFNATLSQMTQITYDLRNTDGFNAKESKVVFVGTSVDYYDVEPFRQYKDMWAIKPSVLGSHTAPYYYEYILDFPIKVCGDDVQAELEGKDKVKMMPCYPEKGYIDYVDDKIVVKLSEPEEKK